MDLLKSFLSIVDGFKITTIFGMIVLDTILGIVVAIKNGVFDIHKIADFLDSSVMALVIGYYAVGVFVLMEPTYAIAVPATWLLIEAKLAADVIQKLRALGAPVEKK